MPFPGRVSCLSRKSAETRLDPARLTFVNVAYRGEALAFVSREPEQPNTPCGRRASQPNKPPAIRGSPK